LLLALALLAGAPPVIAGETTDQVVVDNKQIAVPMEKGATVVPFGQGALIKRPHRPAASVRPFGSGAIVKEPGKPDVVCSRLGGRTVCR
jgi:putative transposon-encoded protein